MLNLNARLGRLSFHRQHAALRAAPLLTLPPMLLVALLAGCAAKGEHVSGLEHSGAGRGYNASAARDSDSSGLAANTPGASSIQDAKGKRHQAGAGGTAEGADEMAQGAMADASGDSASEGDGAADDDESSLTEGEQGSGTPGAPGTKKRRGRGAGHSVTGADGTSGDGSQEGAAADGSTPGALAAAPGVSKGARGRNGRRKGAGGAQDWNGGSADMTGEDDDDSDTRIAAVEVASGRVQVDEEYQPLTLGGALPVVLGVNEEGRFDFDQFALRDEVKSILDGLAERLKTAEYDRLDVIGYTDRIGSVDYNQRLSELRAYAVAQYLMHKGVPENKIRYEGRGNRDPLTQADECRELAREDLIACLQRDRRVEIEASIHRKHATVQ